MSISSPVSPLFTASPQTQTLGPARSVFLGAWADAFFELTGSLPEECHNDRWFLRKYCNALLHFDENMPLLLPVPAWDVKILDTAFQLLYRIATEAYEHGMQINNREMTNAAKGIHATLRRLRLAISLSVLPEFDNTKKGPRE